MFPVCLQGQYWWTSPHVNFRVRMGSGSCVWDMANCYLLSLNFRHIRVSTQLMSWRKPSGRPRQCSAPLPMHARACIGSGALHWRGLTNRPYPQLLEYNSSSPLSSFHSLYTDKHIIERQAKSQQIAEQSLLSCLQCLLSTKSSA